MNQFVFEVELDRRKASDDDIDKIHAALDDWWVSVSESVAGNLTLVISLPAEGLRQAVATGLALTTEHGAALVVSAMPQDLRDERLGWVPVPETISVTEAAERLGTSRQAVLQRIESGSIPASKVGREWRIPAGAVPDNR